MTLNTEAYKRAAYPPPLVRPGVDVPRCFLLKWDTSKAKTSSQSKFVKREAWGVVFPNGRVTMDYGTSYMTMSDLTEGIAALGSYEVTWLDEMEQPA